VTDRPAYYTDGDPYSDPPRAKVCSLCGALVSQDYAGTHDGWHGSVEGRLGAVRRVTDKVLSTLAAMERDSRRRTPPPS
jgi:hypothetical protein